MDGPWISQVIAGIPSEAYFAAAFAVVLIGFATGRIVFRREVNDVRKDRDDRLLEVKTFFETRETEREAHKDEMITEISNERDVLRQSGQVKDETISLLLGQIAELKELARTGVNVLNALPQSQSSHRAEIQNHPMQSEPPVEGEPSNG